MPQISGRLLGLQLALRQLAAGRRRYIGTLLVAALLTFFACAVGRMDTWLGPDGEGMMDAFNPADHDLGVQVFGSLTAQKAEERVLEYTDIRDSYLLAMPSVGLMGADYTANVISEPERFKLLAGKTCSADDELVVTEFVAADLGLSIGDSITLRGNTGSADYRISGIYACANNMGANIGMSREAYLKYPRTTPRFGAAIISWQTQGKRRR